MHHYEDYLMDVEQKYDFQVRCLGCRNVYWDQSTWATHACFMPVLSCEDVDEGVNG